MPYKDPEKNRACIKAWRERNRERKAAIDKAWRKNNPEKVRICRERNRERKAAANKAWCERNRERRAAANKAWRKNNPEKVRICRERNRERKAARDKIYHERNREQRAAANKAWRERNRERIVTYRKVNRERTRKIEKAWVERNRDLVNEKVRRRRCRKRNVSVYLTASETQQIVILERTRQELQRETRREHHIDHILPIVHGGIHHPVNLRIIDGKENLSKQAKLLPEAIALAPEHFRLYSERISTERAWEFVRQLAAGLGLGEDDLDALVTGKPLKRKPTLEDFMA